MNCVTFEFNANLEYEGKVVTQILMHMYFNNEDFEKYETLTLKSFNDSLYLKSININRSVSCLNASMTGTLELYTEVEEQLVFTKSELTNEGKLETSESTSSFKTDEMFKYFNFQMTPDYNEDNAFMLVQCSKTNINNIFINNNKC